MWTEKCFWYHIQCTQVGGAYLFRIFYNLSQKLIKSWVYLTASKFVDTIFSQIKYDINHRPWCATSLICGIRTVFIHRPRSVYLFRFQMNESWIWRSLYSPYRYQFVVVALKIFFIFCLLLFDLHCHCRIWIFRHKIMNFDYMLSRSINWESRLK